MKQKWSYHKGYIIDFENIEGIRERELEDEMEML